MRVLIVEDEPCAAEVVRDVLLREAAGGGHRVGTRADARGEAGERG